MYLNPSIDDRIVCWIFVGSVAFFLFAAMTVPSPEQVISGGKTNYGKGRNKTKLSVSEFASNSLRQQEIIRERVFNEVYRTAFLKLKDEHETFLDAEDAKQMLPGLPGTIRKPLCGGWVSNVPPLVLRFYGSRCPPLELI